jgi:hypothetical protein
MHSSHIFTRGSVPLGLVALSATGLLAAVALSFVIDTTKFVEVHLTPATKMFVVGEVIPIAITVEAPVPVNAFMGELVFSTDTFEVVSIEYNTQLADLWVTEPWYSKADNVVYFAGGTTRIGGFTGTDTLLTVYLRSTKTGATALSLRNMRVLAHDGFGTDVPLKEPVDVLFTSERIQAQSTVLTDTEQTETYTIIPSPPVYDLNTDGKVSFADVGILLLNLGSADSRYDFNRDGTINQTDLTLLLENRE